MEFGHSKRLIDDTYDVRAGSSYEEAIKEVITWLRTPNCKKSEITLYVQNVPFTLNADSSLEALREDIRFALKDGLLDAVGPYPTDFDPALRIKIEQLREAIKLAEEARKLVDLHMAATANERRLRQRGQNRPTS